MTHGPPTNVNHLISNLVPTTDISDYRLPAMEPPQDESAHTEIPLENHLSSLILANNPSAQFIDTSSHGTFAAWPIQTHMRTPTQRTPARSSTRRGYFDNSSSEPIVTNPIPPHLRIPGQPRAQTGYDNSSQGPSNLTPLPTLQRVQNVEGTQPQQNRQAYHQRPNVRQQNWQPYFSVGAAPYERTGTDSHPRYPNPQNPMYAPHVNTTHQQGRGGRQNPQPYGQRTDGQHQNSQGRGGGNENNQRPFNPREDRLPLNYRGYAGGRPNQISASPSIAQINFLHQMARVVVPQAEMSCHELTVKENFRLALENICREAIFQHELKHNKDFDAKTVQLKCFGSLSSGFATHSSDMDLALVSPNSVPDSSSIDSEIPRLLEKVLLDLGFGARLLTKTRVPIIKLCEEPTGELAEALLDERAKWEKERDSPPKPEPNEMGQPPKDGSKDGPAFRDEAETVVSSNSEESSSGTGTNTAGGPPEIDEAEDHLKSKRQRKRFRKRAKRSKGNQKVPSTSSNEATAATSSSPEVSPGSTDKKTAGTPAQAPDPQLQSEVVRPDKELVFLYNLAMEEGWYDPGERKIIEKFLSAVENNDSGLDDGSLEKARLELKSVTQILHRYRAPSERESRLDFPKIGVGIQCDINFSNPLALHNTKLLRCYSHCDPRVRPVIIFVKAWAKQRKINSPYHGTLSSYGYVLMVLHFLINIVRPPVLPNLQTVPEAAEDDSPGNDEIIDGYGVRFWRSEEAIKSRARRHEISANTKDSVGALLRGFYHYYAHQTQFSPCNGFHWVDEIISIRSNGGILPKKAKDWVGAKTVTVEPTNPDGVGKEIKQRYLLAIEDPFETEHNIARTVIHTGVRAIRDEFQRAHAIIQHVGSRGVGEELFAEGDDRDRRRAFGPLLTKEELAKWKGKGKAKAKAEPKAEPSSEKNGSVPGKSKDKPHAEKAYKGETMDSESAKGKFPEGTRGPRRPRRNQPAVVEKLPPSAPNQTPSPHPGHLIQTTPDATGPVPSFSTKSLTSTDQEALDAIRERTPMIDEPAEGPAPVEQSAIHVDDEVLSEASTKGAEMVGDTHASG